MAMRHGTTRSDRIEARERRGFVLDLRRSGSSYRQIASIMRTHPVWRRRISPRYDERHACRDVAVELSRLDAELSAAAAGVRQLELDRLDRLQLGIWNRAIMGDEKAIAQVLHIMARRARYIAGLEAPQQVAPVNQDGSEPYAAAPSMPEVDEHSIAAMARQLAEYGRHLLATEPHEQEGN
jgi:hypothetical protein